MGVTVQSQGPGGKIVVGQTDTLVGQTFISAKALN